LAFFILCEREFILIIGMPRSFHREGSGHSFILRRTPDSKNPAEAVFFHKEVETD